MRIRDPHAVDLDEDKVVQLLGENRGVELRHDLPHRGRFPRAGRAGDVDTGARSFGDGRFEVGVDRLEFLLATGQGRRNGGHVELGSSHLEGRREEIAGREDPRAQGGEFKRLLHHDPKTQRSTPPG